MMAASLTPVIGNQEARPATRRSWPREYLNGAGAADIQGDLTDHRDPWPDETGGTSAN